MDSAYRNKLLLLPAVRSVADEVYIFQQDKALARRVRQRVELLPREIPEFTAADVMWPPNCEDLNLVTSRAGAVYCNRSCLFVCVCVCMYVSVCESITTITRNCVHQSSPN